MFRIIRFLVGLVALVLFVWFGANIPLGSRTLFQHLQAIGRTRETRDLLEGTRDSAKPFVEGVRKRLSEVHVVNETRSSPKMMVDASAAPADEIPPADRQRLRKILGTGHAARPQ
jgi:hypothetical protein